MNYSQRLNLKMSEGEIQKDGKGTEDSRKRKSLSLNKRVFITVTSRFPLSCLCGQWETEWPLIAGLHGWAFGDPQLPVQPCERQKGGCWAAGGNQGVKGLQEFWQLSESWLRFILTKNMKIGGNQMFLWRGGKLQRLGGEPYILYSSS